MSNIVETYIERVQNAIFCAENNKSKLTQKHFDLDGMSSKKIRIFLNELIKNDSAYLEVGTYLGSTLISALYGNSPKQAYAIDNFSQFEGTLEKFKNNCEMCNVENFSFFNDDCFDLPKDKLSLLKNTNTYFYDGAHGWKSQRDALKYYYDILGDCFIFIVDDWNDQQVKFGTNLAISELGLKIHKSWQLSSGYLDDKKEWWNGLYICVAEKQKSKNFLGFIQ